jgi:acetyltransferase-like isoleucine patch superfamily enzyme
MNGHDATRGFAMSNAITHGFSLVAEKLLRWCVNPRWRARLLGMLGASVGRNVRIYEGQIFNLENGFAHLSVADDVHIGPGCRLDLSGRLEIGPRTTLSPGVTVLTHADPGSSHGSAIAMRYPPRFDGVSIGSDCWIGANATLLGGARIGKRVVIGAASVVRDAIPDDTLAAGAPATVRKHFEN